jgi:hypothetical protein
MEKPFHPEGCGVTHPPILETRRKPTMIDYVKEELEIVRFQPSRDMIFSYMGEMVDELCGIKKRQHNDEDDGSTYSGNSIMMTTMYTIDQSTYGTMMTPEIKTRTKNASMIETTPSSRRSGYDCNHQHILPDVIYAKIEHRDSKSSLDSTKLSSNGSNAELQQYCWNSASPKLVSPPQSSRRFYDFKHIHLPHSVYVMAAAHDLQEYKRLQVH